MGNVFIVQNYMVTSCFNWDLAFKQYEKKILKVVFVSLSRKLFIIIIIIFIIIIYDLLFILILLLPMFVGPSNESL